MGIKIYWWILILVVVLGLIMPQEGYRRKYYIIIMASLHAFVSGFRYHNLTGDLIKYHTSYTMSMSNGYFSEKVFNEGRNFGFYWFQKFLADITGGNFQFFLLLVAIIIEISVAVLIYRFSPKPWLSYLVWNCLGFYIFGLSAVKQSLAMAIIVFAMIAIFDKRPVKFVILVLLAGAIHVPALVFLPAYWIGTRKFSASMMTGYIVATIGIYMYRTSIVKTLSDTYYEEMDFMTKSNTALGGGFFLIVFIIAVGLLLQGFRIKQFQTLFGIMIVAAIIQMFSGYDNIFTRLAYYYYQFSILFIPMFFYERKDIYEIDYTSRQPMLPFNQKSMKILACVTAIILVLFYYRAALGVTIDYQTDNYLDFKFMWEMPNYHEALHAPR